MARRICEVVAYADGHALSRTGFQALPRFDGKIRWHSKWLMSSYDVVQQYGSFEAYVEKLRERGFMLRRASEKTFQSVAVIAAMEALRGDE